MPIDFMNNLATQILAISLATERLVSILKTLFKWLYEKQDKEATEKVRRIVVLVIAFLSAWATAAFFSDGQDWDLLGKVNIGDDRKLPVFLVGFLACGGSSLWNNILGYTKTVKEDRKNHLRDGKKGGAPN